MYRWPMLFWKTSGCRRWFRNIPQWNSHIVAHCHMIPIYCLCISLLEQCLRFGLFPAVYIPTRWCMMGSRTRRTCRYWQMRILRHILVLSQGTLGLIIIPLHANPTWNFTFFEWRHIQLELTFDCISRCVFPKRLNLQFYHCAYWQLGWWIRHFNATVLGKVANNKSNNDTH